MKLMECCVVVRYDYQGGWMNIQHEEWLHLCIHHQHICTVHVVPST